MSIKLPRIFSLAYSKYATLTQILCMQISIASALLFCFVVNDAVADDISSDSLFDSVSVFKGQGADLNLKEVPGAILSGDVPWEGAYFNAAGFSKTSKSLGESFELMHDTIFASIRQGYELVLLKHHGLQKNAEAGIAYSLRSPDLHLGVMSVNFSAGVGISQAFGTPTYEDGSKEKPDQRYNTQQLMLFEFEWRIRGLDNLAIVTRIHHRSGVYGLIAPRHVGSNFFAAGIRYNF